MAINFYQSYSKLGSVIFVASLVGFVVWIWLTLGGGLGLSPVDEGELYVVEEGPRVDLLLDLDLNEQPQVDDDFGVTMYVNPQDGAELSGLTAVVDFDTEALEFESVELINPDDYHFYNGSGSTYDELTSGRVRINILMDNEGVGINNMVPVLRYKFRRKTYESTRISVFDDISGGDMGSIAIIDNEGYEGNRLGEGRDIVLMTVDDGSQSCIADSKYGSALESDECCEELSPLIPIEINDDGSCGLFPLNGGFVCSDSVCGDDVCESWENECNCEEDCGSSVSPVSWNTPFVRLVADDFSIFANGKVYEAKDATVSVHSNPTYESDSGLFYTTLEATWSENDEEMRLYIYLYSDGNEWWSNEMRTYGGHNDDWIYYHGDFFRTQIGESATGDYYLRNDENNSNEVGNIRFNGLDFEAFINCENNTDVGGMSTFGCVNYQQCGLQNGSLCSFGYSCVEDMGYDWGYCLPEDGDDIQCTGLGNKFYNGEGYCCDGLIDVYDGVQENSYFCSNENLKVCIIAQEDGFCGPGENWCNSGVDCPNAEFGESCGMLDINGEMKEVLCDRDLFCANESGNPLDINSDFYQGTCRYIDNTVDPIDDKEVSVQLAAIFEFINSSDIDIETWVNVKNGNGDSVFADWVMFTTKSSGGTIFAETDEIMMNVNEGERYTVDIKGEKHRGYRFDKQYQNGRFDLTDREMEPGDLPQIDQDGYYVQDGEVNWDVESQIILNNMVPGGNIDIADLNYDGKVNIFDLMYLREILKDEQDEF